MSPTLTKLFTLHATLDAANTIFIGEVLGGPQKTCSPLPSGYLEGEGYRAELLPGGGDWFTLNPKTATGHIDVRLNLRITKTPESTVPSQQPSSQQASDPSQPKSQIQPTGAIHIFYTGLVRVDEAASKVLQLTDDAVTTDFGDHEWFCAPRMQTSEPGLKWIESAFWLMRGRFVVLDEQGKEIRKVGSGGGERTTAIEYEVFRVT